MKESQTDTGLMPDQLNSSPRREAMHVATLSSASNPPWDLRHLEASGCILTASILLFLSVGKAPRQNHRTKYLRQLCGASDCITLDQIEDGKRDICAKPSSEWISRQTTASYRIHLFKRKWRRLPGMVSQQQQQWMNTSADEKFVVEKRTVYVRRRLAHLVRRWICKAQWRLHHRVRSWESEVYMELPIHNSSPSARPETLHISTYIFHHLTPCSSGRLLSS